MKELSLHQVPKSNRQVALHLQERPQLSQDPRRHVCPLPAGDCRPFLPRRDQQGRLLCGGLLHKKMAEFFWHVAASKQLKNRHLPCEHVERGQSRLARPVYNSTLTHKPQVSCVHGFSSVNVTLHPQNIILCMQKHNCRSVQCIL